MTSKGVIECREQFNPLLAQGRQVTADTTEHRHPTFRYSPLSGHSLIAVVTILLETGMIPAQVPETVVKLETPVGVVQATTSLDTTGQVERVSFLNVPSFVYTRGVGGEVNGLGHITLDLAFGSERLISALRRSKER